MTKRNKTEADILIEAASIIDFYGTGDEPIIEELHTWAAMVGDPDEPKTVETQRDSGTSGA